MALQFNRAAAKAAGYDDAEIDEYLKTATPPDTAAGTPSYTGTSVQTPNYQQVGANYEATTPTTGGFDIDPEVKNILDYKAKDIAADYQRTGGKMKTFYENHYNELLTQYEAQKKAKEEQTVKTTQQQEAIKAAQAGLYETPQHALDAGVPSETVAKLKKKGVFNKSAEEPKTKEEINEVKDVIYNIDDVLDEDLGFLGFWGGAQTSIPGTKTFATGKRIQQIKDQLSLASRGKLKGSGQISNEERRMLANASTALDVGMREEDFREEMKKVRKILNRNIGGEAGNTLPTIETKNKSKELPPWEIAAETPQRKFGFNLDFGKKEDPYEKLKRGGELAKQSLNVNDPIKKERLLAESRLLSEQGGEASRATKTNPLIYAGAKAQKFLGETETLPAIYATIGAATTGGSPVGTGVGAAYGKSLQKKLDTSEKTPKQRLKESAEIAWTGTKYAVTAKILNAGSKYISNAIKAKTLSPSKITNFLRDEAAREVPTINTSKILKEGDRLSKLYPNAKEFWDLERKAFKNKMATKDLLNKITDMGAQSWTKSGDPRVKATAGFMRLLYKKAREDILSQAPNVAKFTKTLAQLKDVPKWIKGAKSVTWELIKLLGIITLAKNGRAVD